MPTYIRIKDLPNSASSLNTDDYIMLSGSVAGARKILKADFMSTVADTFNATPNTYKLATLDASNKVDSSQWPASAFSYQGVWAASTNTPTLADGTGTAGYTYYASDAGSVNFGAGAISFTAGDAVVYDGSVWQKVPDVANILDGKGTVAEGKETLQIPDVGTAANEVPLCGFLGSGAFRENDCIVSEHTSVGTDAGGVAVNFYTNNDTLHCVKNGPVVSVTGRLMVQTTSATNQLRFTLPYSVGDFGNSSGHGFASVGIIDSSAGTYTAGYATFTEGNDYVQVRHTPEANDEFYISFTYHTNA